MLGLPLPPLAELIEQGRVVALNFPIAMNPGLARALGTMLKQDFQRAVLNRIQTMSTDPAQARRPVMFVCDEYQAFATTGENEPSGDEKFFSLARQARCIPIVATQSISSLRSTLTGESWRTLLQGLRTKIFLALSDDFSAHMAADLCGKAERLKPSYSITEAGQDARVSMLTGRPAAHRTTVSAAKTYSLLLDYVFQPKVFAELQNAQAIVLPYDGLNPQPPTYCYLKPYYCGGAGGSSRDTESTGEARRRRAAAARDRNVELTFEEGLTYVDRGDWNNAIRSLEEAMELAPDDADIARWLRRARSGKQAKSAVQRSLSQGDWADAAQSLDQVFAASGGGASTPTRATVMATGTEVLREDGLLAFQRANAEYRHVHSDTVGMFRGSSTADARYQAARAVLSRATAALTPSEAGFTTQTVQSKTEDLRAATNTLEALRRDEVPAAVRAAANEWRQAVLRAAVTRAAVVAVAPYAVVLPDSVRGEDDRQSVAFIREMESLCAMNRDLYCAAWKASSLKDKGPAESYPARRNAEHYLFAKALAEDLAKPLSGTAALTLTPSWSLMKHVVPGRTFATSRPSKDEIKWGFLGGVVGLTGMLNPTQP